MTKIRHIALSFFLLATVSCATLSTWWTNFEKDPVAQIQEYVQEVNVVLQDVAVVWTIVQPLLGASATPAVTLQYTNAVADVQHANSALLDLATAAADAQQATPPDFTAAISDVNNAIGNLLAIVKQYYTGPLPSTTGAVGASPSSGVAVVWADANARAAKLKIVRISVRAQ